MSRRLVQQGRKHLEDKLVFIEEQRESIAQSINCIVSQVSSSARSLLAERDSKKFLLQYMAVMQQLEATSNRLFMICASLPDNTPGAGDALSDTLPETAEDLLLPSASSTFYAESVDRQPYTTQSFQIHNSTLESTYTVQSPDMTQSVIEQSKEHIRPPTDTRVKDTPEISLTSISSPPFSPIPRLTLTMGKSMDVIVTVVDNPSMFWVQPVDPELDDLMDEISHFYGKHGKPLKGDLFLGMECCAMYKDNSWYRARITAIHCKENSSAPSPTIRKSNSILEVELIYIDYGNSERVELNRLRHLEAQFRNLPSQAYCCALSEVSPPHTFQQWAPEHAIEFNRIVRDRPLQAVLASPMDECPVTLLDLYYPTEAGDPGCGPSVTDIMQNVGDFLIVHRQARKATQSQTATMLDRILNIKTRSPGWDCKLLHKDIIASLMPTIETKAATKSPKDLGTSIINHDTCGAKKSVSERQKSPLKIPVLWLEKKKSTCDKTPPMTSSPVSVSVVDKKPPLLTSSPVSVSVVDKKPPLLTSSPVSVSAGDIKSSLLSGSPPTMFPTDRKPSLPYTNKSDHEHRACESAEPNVISGPSNDTPVSWDVDERIWKMRDDSDQVSRNVQDTVTTDSKSDKASKVEHWEDLLADETFDECLDEAIKASSSPEKDFPDHRDSKERHPEVGEQSSRASDTSEQRPKTPQQRLKELGFPPKLPAKCDNKEAIEKWLAEEDVVSGDNQMQSQDLSTSGALLDADSTPNRTHDTADTLQEALKEPQCFISENSPEPEKNLSELDIDACAVSSDLFCEESAGEVEAKAATDETMPLDIGKGSFDRASCLTEQSLSTGEDSSLQIMMSHIVSPSEFYVHLVSPEAGCLDKMKSELHHHYSKLNNFMLMKFLGQLGIGDMCCAQFTEDDSFYRAEIVDVRYSGERKSARKQMENPDELKVFYIDFGNSEWLSSERVLPLVPRFMDMPAFAYCCSLIDVYPLKGKEWSKESISGFEKLTGYNKPLLSFVIQSKKGSTGKEHLQMILVDTTGESDVWLNRELVAMGLAKSKSARDVSPEVQANEPKDQVEMNDWNPMKEDFYSIRNSYEVDVDDAGVATVGYSFLNHNLPPTA